MLTTPTLQQHMKLSSDLQCLYALAHTDTQTMSSDIVFVSQCAKLLGVEKCAGLSHIVHVEHPAFPSPCCVAHPSHSSLLHSLPKVSTVLS